MEKFYTIQESDIGHIVIRAFGKAWTTTDFMGHILPRDVGKRIYRVPTDAGDSFILQVENDEQRDKRTS